MVNVSIKKFLYGFLFLAAIPIYFIWLASNIELNLPTYHIPNLGAVLSILGLGLILGGFSDLFFKGKGLPMNAFPPKNIVKNGLYGVVPHPIYVGFVMLVAGISFYFGSSTGLWLITPIALVGCLSLVWGYERLYLLQTFQVLASPWLGPPSNDRLLYRIGSFFALFIPWVIVFEAFKFAGIAHDVFDIHFSFEQNIAVMVESYPIYASAYLFVLLPFLFSKLDDLKYFFNVGWLSIVVMSLLYFAIPAISPPRELSLLISDNGWVGSIYSVLHQLLALEMIQASPYNAAFPSYHVVWSVLVAQILSRKNHFWALGAWIWCILISITCFTTGMHALADLIAGFIMGLLLFQAKGIWLQCISWANKLGNSYRSKMIGPFRIMSHFKFSFFAGFTQVLITTLLVGIDYAFIIVLMSCVGLLGAVLWGWLVEGGKVSQRPLGYFGSAIGFLSIGFLLILMGYDLSIIIAGSFCAGTFAQAVGRLRCIVQGCCHGGAINVNNKTSGFVIHAERSRVVTLSNLANQSIYPTQLYSILGNLALGIILIRLWTLQVNTGLIIGLYLVFTGFLRFVEEGYRGEIQTKKYYGLAIYQWLALFFLLLGTYIMTFNLSYTRPIASFDFSILVWAIIGGLIGGFVGSVDFPNSKLPFSKLEL